MKKLKVFCLSWISAHLAFLGFDFFMFFYHFFFMFIISFHVLSFLIIFFDFFMGFFVLQHFRPKNDKNVMNTWQNLMIIFNQSQKTRAKRLKSDQKC